MTRQDTSPFATDGEKTDQAESLRRRRALLAGLGKGGALVAAAAPVSSFAVGRVKTADGKQCTVSGQMSAVISQAASANPCAAYHSTYFFTVDTVVINDLPTSGGVKSAVKNGQPGAYIETTDAVYYKRDADKARKLTPANRPSGYASVGLKASDILAGASADSVLKVLHATSESDTAYFLAAFFSAALAAPSGAEKVPFAAADVQAQWVGSNKSAAFTLYKLISTVGRDTSKLG